MQHVISNEKIHLAGLNSYVPGYVRPALIAKFMVWCDTQEKNSFLWLGIALVAGIGTVLPVTLFAITFIGDNDLALWITACAVNVPILVVSLAIQSTKVILPVIFFAWIVDSIIIVYCLTIFFAR